MCDEEMTGTGPFYGPSARARRAAERVLVPVQLTDAMRERMAHIADGPLRTHDEYWAEMLDAALIQETSGAR
jgi:hypothetical protein